MHETATGAELLAAVRDFRLRVIARRDAIETSGDCRKISRAN